MRRVLISCYKIKLILLGTALLLGCTKKSGNDKVTIAVIPPALTSTFHIEVQEGAKEEAAKLGYLIKTPAPKSESDFLAQVNMVETLISQKVAAISVCAINNEAICSSVEKANAAKIPFFVHNSLVSLPADNIQVNSYIGYNQQKAGAMCGEAMVARLIQKFGQAKGKVIILQGLPGFHTNERTKGFLAGLNLKKNKAIVVEKYPAKWRRDEGKKVMESLLTKDKNIAGVFGCSDAMMQGAAQAAQDAGANVITIGIDGNPDTIADIENGIVTGTLAVFPREMGRITVRTIHKKLSGESVNSQEETPMMLVTKENLEKFKAM